MTESAADKALRLLTSGALIVNRVTPAGQVSATCRGEGTVHHLGYRQGAWWCTCPVTTDQCSHLRALRRVVAVDLAGSEP